jgi:2-phosphosulfolactate phosphatase
MKIDVCFSPSLYPYYADNAQIVVVADIFRATTTICAAFSSGATAVIPVRSLEEALSYKEKGYLVGGERNVKKFDFGDFGNSPSEYTKEKVSGKEVVFSTTNGTRAIDEASGSCNSLIIGSFSNLSAVAAFCAAQKRDILVLCAGWKEKFNIEDSLFGGALVEKLADAGYDTSFDAALSALSMWKEAKHDMTDYIRRCEHIKRLEASGLLNVVEYCLTPDTTHVLPVYDNHTKKIIDRLHDRTVRR